MVVILKRAPRGPFSFVRKVAFKIGRILQAGYTNAVLSSCVDKVGLAPTFCFQNMIRQNIELLTLLTPVVTGLGYELLGIEKTGNGKKTVLRLYIDSHSGIGLEDCARVSDQVAGVLDVSDPVQGPYNLEVSSPGFDRPLFTLEHFMRFCGEQVAIKLAHKINGRHNVTGVIKNVKDDQVIIETEGTELVISVNDISKAHLVTG